MVDVGQRSAALVVPGGVERLADLVMAWIERDLKDHPAPAAKPKPSALEPTLF
ncbi:MULTISPECIES: hypothetical protein [unclassified Bifidobacterium]|uniref:hypothetical protein n=1 Tax=unclassified Bifidobacterium TaxID=2608897 RepID=UPI0015E3B908|nr:MULTISPECIES: hypothetical protein [unclassified Bifidobacterium]